MRRLILLLAIVVGWMSFTKAERKQIAKAARGALAKADKAA